MVRPQWLIPVLPTTQEAETEGLHELTHKANLGNTVRTHLKMNNKKEKRKKACIQNTKITLKIQW